MSGSLGICQKGVRSGRSRVCSCSGSVLTTLRFALVYCTVPLRRCAKLQPCVHVWTLPQTHEDAQ